MTIRIDENGIPKLVQEWQYGTARTFEIKTIKGDGWYFLDMDIVRDFSCRGLKKWDMEKDQMAVDHFVEKLWRIFQ